MSMIRHQVIMTIECDDAQGSNQACDHVHAWLETFGHTAPGHGFVFVSTTPVPKIGKRLEGQRKRGT